MKWKSMSTFTHHWRHSHESVHWWRSVQIGQCSAHRRFLFAKKISQRVSAISFESFSSASCRVLLRSTYSIYSIPEVICLLSSNTRRGQGIPNLFSWGTSSGVAHLWGAPQEQSRIRYAKKIRGSHFHFKSLFIFWSMASKQKLREGFGLWTWIRKTIIFKK